MRKYLLIFLSLFFSLPVFSQKNKGGNLLIKEVFEKADKICELKNYTDQKTIHMGTYAHFDFLKMKPDYKIPPTTSPREYFEVYRDRKNRITRINQYSKDHYFQNNDFYLYYVEGITFMICYTYHYASREKENFDEPGMWVGGFFVLVDEQAYYFSLTRYYVDDGALPMNTLYNIMELRSDLRPIKKLKIFESKILYRTWMVYKKENNNFLDFEYLEVFEQTSIPNNIEKYSLTNLYQLFNIEDVYNPDFFPITGGQELIEVGRLYPDQYDDGQYLWLNGMYQYK
ncbi:hypothetical protein AAG747_22635 [Rapidithrix thailandica]|uniref:Uncharacterized protein n=1 Tax=Rapidithrix thailandica TaxID=413964 RepID=A0AAW9S6C6_9BACT